MNCVSLAEGVLKARRLYESPYSHEEYEEGMIPMEWEGMYTHDSIYPALWN